MYCLQTLLVVYTRYIIQQARTKHVQHSNGTGSGTYSNDSAAVVNATYYPDTQYNQTYKHHLPPRAIYAIETIS